MLATTEKILSAVSHVKGLDGWVICLVVSDGRLNMSVEEVVFLQIIM